MRWVHAQLACLVQSNLSLAERFVRAHRRSLTSSRVAQVLLATFGYFAGKLLTMCACMLCCGLMAEVTGQLHSKTHSWAAQQCRCSQSCSRWCFPCLLKSACEVYKQTCDIPIKMFVDWALVDGNKRHPRFKEFPFIFTLINFSSPHNKVDMDITEIRLRMRPHTNT